MALPPLSRLDGPPLRRSYKDAHGPPVPDNLFKVNQQKGYVLRKKIKFLTFAEVIWICFLYLALKINIQMKRRRKRKMTGQAHAAALQGHAFLLSGTSEPNNLAESYFLSLV